MDYTRIKKVNKRQLNKMIQREGIEVGNYFDKDKTYRVLFRRIARSETPVVKVRLYYPTEYVLDIGSIITIKDEPYMIYSMDGIESDVYKTSVAIKCDGTLPILYDNKIVNIPFMLLSDTWKVSHKTISVVTGSIIIAVQTNQYSDLLSVNDGFDQFGNYYSIANRFKNNGITYINLEQSTSPPDYFDITYTGDDSIDMSNVQHYQMNFVLTNNGTVVEPQPTLTYTSSDDTIATIDASGVLTPVAVGTVDITAAYTEGNASRTVTVSITQGTPPVPEYRYEVHYSGSSNVLKAGGSVKTFNVSVFDNQGNDVTAEWVNDGYYTGLTWTATSSTISNLDDYLLWTQQQYNIIKLKLLDTYTQGANKDIRVSALLDGVVIGGVDMVTGYL